MKRIWGFLLIALLVSVPCYGANEVLRQNSVSSSMEQIVFNVTGSFSPVDSATNWTMGGSPVNGALTLSALADAAGRQSIKIDLGAKRATSYAVYAAVDYTGETPAAGQIEYYWAPSTSGTQANGNIAGNSGADAVCPDGALGSVTLAEFLNMGCVFIGVLITHDGVAVQNGYIGRFDPPNRYGQMIVVNNGGDAFEADDVESHTVMNPIVDEVQ